MTRIYAAQDLSLIATAIAFLINGLPAAAIAISGYYGMTFLMGRHGDTMHPAGRNLVGVLVLIFGLVVGLIIESGWYWMIQKAYEAIAG